MSETIPGGLYKQPDGSYKDANGKPVKLTAEVRKQAKAAGIKLSTPKPASKPKEEETPPAKDEG